MGRPPKNLTKAEIKHAIRESKNVTEATNILNVSYPTFEKYRKKHGISKHPDAGTWENVDPTHGHAIAEERNLDVHDVVFNTGTTNSNPALVKFKLIKEGLKEEKCEHCGYNTHSKETGRVPLVMIFKDRDETNFEYSNLMFACMNCLYHLRRDKVAGRFAYISHAEGPYRIRNQYI